MLKSDYVGQKSNGERVEFQINLSLPEPDPESEHLSGCDDQRCLVEIAELGFSQYVYGIDAVQAYCLSVHCLKLFLTDLKQQGWRFYLKQDSERELDLVTCLFP